MLILPEIKLKKLLDGFLGLIQANFNTETDPTKTFIYQLFNGNVVDGYDFYHQAQKILLRNPDDPRMLMVRTFFDRTRAGIPTIHINLPAQSPIGDGIGFDPNYDSGVIWDDENEQFEQTSTFGSKYNIIITSDNQFEVLIIFYALQCVMIANHPTLELNGLRNPKFGAQDLMLKDDNIPNLFARTLSFDMINEVTVPDLVWTAFYNEIVFYSGIHYGAIYSYGYGDCDLGFNNI